MASLSNEGGRMVLYIQKPMKSKKSLGRIPRRQAEGIQRHVKVLIAASLDGSTPHPSTSAWLAGIDLSLRSRLEKVGLAAPLVKAADQFTIEEAAEVVERQRYKWAKATRINFRRSLAAAKRHFGEGADLLIVTPSDAKDYAAWLVGEGGYSEASAGLMLRNLSYLFDAAMDKGLSDRNPLARVPIVSSRVGKKAYISVEDSLKVQEVISPDCRLVFGLARWCGFRVPSEPRALRWGYIDLDQGRMALDSPKTGLRYVPIFPRVESLLLAAYHNAPDGSESVSQITAQMARHHLMLAIRRAGLKPWPRLWHSLRASCETDLLTARFDPHKVAAFIGHSLKVQQAAYALITDDDYTAARQYQHGEKMGVESACNKSKQPERASA